MRRIILALALVAATIAAAKAQIWIMSPASQMPGKGHGSGPPTTGALLLEDGTSILLLEDGSSQLCLEGGC